MTRGFDFNIKGQAGAAWVDRAQRAASLLAVAEERLGSGATLADVGCGDEKLRSVLESRGLHFAYSGFDVNPQTDRVTQFDAITEELPQRFDAIVSLGLIEYIPLPAYFTQSRAQCSYLVVSHVVREFNDYTQERIDRLGWVNHMTSSEVEAELAAADFKVQQYVVTADGKTVIWLCA